MGHPEDSALHIDPSTHPHVRGALADALQEIAPNYGRGEHHSAARKIVEDATTGGTPPPAEQDARGAKDGPAFDAEKFVADKWPGFEDRFTPEARGVIVSLVDLAHARGMLIARSQESENLADYLARVMEIVGGKDRP